MVCLLFTQKQPEQDEVCSGCLLAWGFAKVSGHQNLHRYVPSGLHLAVFNCGYLPGGDKNLTTQTADTLTALNTLLPLLRPNGLISIALYPGHPEGSKEAAAVQEWASSLAQTQYAVLHYGFINRRNHPPFLLAIEKLPPAPNHNERQNP